MSIKMPEFRKIYKHRDGVDKFFYNKISEMAEAINTLQGADSTSTVTVSVKDTESPAGNVAGAKVKLTNTTDANKTYESSATGTAGGATISTVAYATYKVTVTAPTGYTALTSYDNIIVDSATETLAVSVNKNTS